MPDTGVQRLGRVLWIGLFLGACRPMASPVPPDGVDITQYDLTVELDPATRRLDARALLHVDHPDTLTLLPLAFEGLILDTVRVNGAVVSATRQGEGLYVPLAGTSASQIEVVYHGVPHLGLHAQTYGTQRVVYTDSWPDNGRGWLPGVHHPSDPARLALDLTVPLGYEAVASGALTARDTLTAHVRYRWRLDVPVPTYAFAFAVADFSRTEETVGDTLPVHYYMLAEDSVAVGRLHRTPQALAFLDDLLGPYPFSGYASVQVPISFAGMENAAAVFLTATLFQTAEVEAVQVHELVHQWFGNRVPIADWADLWLSEGTATYLTTLFYEHTDGLDVARQRWVDLATLSPARQGSHTALVTSQPQPAEALLTWVPYDKGASVLHLLRRTLGDEAFFEVLRATYRDYAGRPLSTAAFQQQAEALTGRDLEAFFDYWVYGDDLPILRTTWEPALRTLSWAVVGDAGTLAGVSFDLQVRQRDQVRYVVVERGGVTVAEANQRPTVHPVGVMLRVE